MTDAPAFGDWQDIETVPSGRSVLLLLEHKEHDVRAVRVGNMFWINDRYAAFHISRHEGDRYKDRPLKWMPLPELFG